MDIKNAVITSISLTILVAILFIVGFYTVRYLQVGYKESGKKIADAPKVELTNNTEEKKQVDNGPDSVGIEENNGTVMGSKTNQNSDSTGISDEIKPVIKPVTKPSTSTNNGFDEETPSTSYQPITLRSIDLTISSPRVKEVDDNYIRFDYTFNLSQNAKTYLNRTGVTYIIDAENCRDYFNEDEYIFEKSYRKGTLPTSFSVELPEEALDSDNNYLEKATFEIEANGKTVITGTTYVPSCR